MPDESLSEQLARQHAALQLNQIPDAVVHAAKLHILDAMGCLLAGSRLEPGKLAYDLAIATGSGVASSATATLFGTNARVSYLDAVQAMSVAAHCGEMDDIHSGAGTCIGGMIVPALLAMAEKFGGDGHRFLEAAIVGYETTARVGLAIGAPSLFARGWWPSTVCGAFGVVAAGAKFLGWSAEKTANSLGIASLHTGGMITGGQEGATARHLVFGRAAQSGVLALLAAEQGFTGPKRAFEDPRGFCLTLCNSPKWEYLQNGEQFHLPDVAFKPYPCARQLHAGVEALLRLLDRYAITARMIEEIELSLPTPNASMVDRPSLTNNRAATLGNGQYVMAVTAVRGKIDLTSFEEEFLRSDQVLSLMRKVKVIANTELDRHFPKYWPARVSVNLSDGRSVTHEVVIPKGESGNPMTREEVEEKFLLLAAPVIGEAKARSVISEVHSLDSLDSLAPLIACLKVSA
jgi:2-methylcitrate dehydratase PrpD